MISVLEVGSVGNIFILVYPSMIMFKVTLGFPYVINYYKYNFAYIFIFMIHFILFRIFSQGNITWSRFHKGLKLWTFVLIKCLTYIDITKSNLVKSRLNHSRFL